MVDLLASGNSKLNPYLQLMFGLFSFNVAWIALSGFQNTNLQVLANGMIFIPLLYASDLLSGRQILEGKGSFSAMSFSFTAPLLFLEVMRFSLGFEFSFLSLPSESYYSAPLKGLSAAGQAAFNGIYAPVFETALVMSIALFTMWTVINVLRLVGVSKPLSSIVAAFVGPIPAGKIFSELHGARGLAFRVVAFMVIYVSMLPVLLEDVTKSTLVRVLGLGIPFLAGFHAALNIGQMGGLLAWMGSLLAADVSAVYWTNLFVVVWFLTNFAGSVVYGNRYSKRLLAGLI